MRQAIPFFLAVCILLLLIADTVWVIINIIKDDFEMTFSFALFLGSYIFLWFVASKIDWRESLKP